MQVAKVTFVATYVKMYAMRKLLRPAVVALALGLVLSLAGCGAMIRLAYNHADFAIRLAANDYFDLDPDQAEVLRPRLESFHVWHRQVELPLYRELAVSARQRAERGVTAADVGWALREVRARYREIVARGIEEALPVVAALNASNLGALERKLAKGNADLEKDYWTGDEERRIAGRMKRLRKQFDDWVGDPTPEQQAILLAYVKGSPNYSIERLVDRKRRQQGFVTLLREHRQSADLGPRLKRFFVEFERDRAPGYAERVAEWDASLVKLVVDIDRSLRPEQRARILARLDRHIEDFRVLAAQGRPAPAGAQPAIR